MFLLVIIFYRSMYVSCYSISTPYHVSPFCQARINPKHFAQRDFWSHRHRKRSYNLWTRFNSTVYLLYEVWMRWLIFNPVMCCLYNKQKKHKKLQCELNHPQNKNKRPKAGLLCLCDRYWKWIYFVARPIYPLLEMLSKWNLLFC